MSEMREKIIKVLDKNCVCDQEKAHIRIADQLLALFPKTLSEGEVQTIKAMEELMNKVAEIVAEHYKIGLTKPHNAEIEWDKAEEWLNDLTKTDLREDVKALLAYQQSIILELVRWVNAKDNR